MSLLPNYKIKYDIVLSMLDKIDRDKISVSKIARRNKASKHTIYKNIDLVKSDYDKFISEDEFLIDI